MLSLLLDLPPGGSLQLAVLRCGVRFAQRCSGYLHMLSAADRERPALLRGPLVAWDEAALANADPEELAAAFNKLIEYLRSSNPIVQRYQTLAERNWGVDSEAAAPDAGVPVVGAACVRDGLQEQQARDPRADALDDGRNTLTALMDWEGQHEAGDHSHTMFKLGDVQQRSDGVVLDVFGDAQGHSATARLSADAALFPFLHPGGLGAFRPGDSISTLLRQRVQQLFSPFTLCKEYLLVMFQVRACVLRPPLPAGLARGGGRPTLTQLLPCSALLAAICCERRSKPSPRWSTASARTGCSPAWPRRNATTPKAARPTTSRQWPGTWCRPASPAPPPTIAPSSKSCWRSWTGTASRRCFSP